MRKRNIEITFYDDEVVLLNYILGSILLSAKPDGTGMIVGEVIITQDEYEFIRDLREDIEKVAYE